MFTKHKMTFTKFKACLSFGKKYEEIAKECIKGEILDSPTGFFKEYDFRTADHTYEVKAETTAWRTGNLFIETLHNNKPSGVMGTLADIWIHFVVGQSSHRMYHIPVADLKKLKDQCREVKGGDNYASVGFLLPERTIQQYLVPETQADTPNC